MLKKHRSLVAKQNNLYYLIIEKWKHTEYLETCECCGWTADAVLEVGWWLLEILMT